MTYDNLVDYLNTICNLVENNIISIQEAERVAKPIVNKLSEEAKEPIRIDYE